MSIKSFKEKRRSGESLREKLQDVFYFIIVSVYTFVIILSLTINELVHLLLGQINWFWYFLVLTILFIPILYFTYRKDFDNLFKIKNYKKGLRGEAYIGDFLKEHFKDKNNYIINDLIIKKNGYVTNIDFIVLSQKGIFIIEVKNKENTNISKEILMQVKYQIENLEEIIGKKVNAIIVYPGSFIRRRKGTEKIKKLNENYIENYIAEFDENLSMNEVKDLYNKLLKYQKNV